MHNNYEKITKERELMTQKVNYSMHFSCFTLILCCNRINSKINDGDDNVSHQGSIDRYINEFYHELIASTMSSSTSSLCYNQMVSLSSALFTQLSTSLYLPT